MAASSEHIVKVTADVSGLKSAFKDAENSTKGFTTSLKGLLVPAIASATAGFGLLSAAAVSGLKSFAEAERLQLRLAGVLKATGNAAGITAGDLADFADQIEATTFKTKEELLGAAAVLATFKSVSGATFKEAIKLAADMSEVFGGDASSAATQLGKALEDPVEGLSALKRIGVSFTEDQKEVIKKLVETGKAAEAQTIILKTLTDQIGGASVSAAKGLAGSFDNLKDSVGDVTENFGGLLAADGNIKKFLDILTGKANDLADALKEAARYRNMLAADPNALNMRDSIERTAENKTRVKELEAANAQLQSKASGAGIASGMAGGALAKNNEEIARLNKETATIEAHLKAIPPLVAEDTKETEKNKKKKDENNKTKEKGVDLDKIRLSLEEKIQDVQSETDAERNGGKDELDIQRQLNSYKKEALQLSEEERQAYEKRYEVVIRNKQAQDKLLEAQDEAAKKAEKLAEEQQKAMMEPFLNAARGIQEAFSSTFEDIFTNGIDSFADLGEKIKKVMIKAAAEIAAALVFKPIIGGILNAAGADGLATAFGVSSSGGGGSSSSVLNIGGSLLSHSGIMGGFNSAVGSAIPSLFGTGAPISATVAGPTLQGSLSALGMNPSTIAIAAGIFAISQMFGKSKPHPGAGFAGALSDTGTFDNLEVAAKHIDPAAAKQLADALTQVFKPLAAAGINFDSQVLRGRIVASGQAQYGIQSGTGPSATINFGKEFDPSDAKAMDKAIVELTHQMLNTAAVTNDDVIKALKNLQYEGKTAADIIGEIQFAASLKGLRDEFEKAVAKEFVAQNNPFFAEIAAQIEQFNGQMAYAVKIGADTTTLEILNQQKLTAIRNKYAAANDNLISGEMSYQDQLSLTTEAITNSNDALKEAQSRFESFAKIAEALKATIDELKLGDLSPLSARAKYDLASANFNSVRARAQGGDTQAMNDLPGVAKAFLTVSREFNAGGGAYTEDFNNVITALQDSQGFAEQQQNIAQNQLTTLNSQLTELQKQSVLLQKLIDEKSSGLVGSSKVAETFQAALADPSKFGLINSNESLGQLNQATYGWGNATGLQVRALGRSIGYGGAFGSGGLDSFLQDPANKNKLDSFNQLLSSFGGTPRFRAGGGMVAPNFPYLINEQRGNGGEMMVPSTGGTIYGASQTQAMLNSSMGNGSGVEQAIMKLAKEQANTNAMLMTLQKQVNNNQLGRRVA